MEPVIEEIITPKNPELEPINFDMVAASTIARRIPTVIMIPKN